MNTEKYDYVLFLLLAGMVFSVICLFAAEIWFATDATLFTFLSGMGSGFVASFFTRVTGKPGPTPIPPNATVDTTATTKVHTEPEVKP